MGVSVSGFFPTGFPVQVSTNSGENPFFTVLGDEIFAIFSEFLRDKAWLSEFHLLSEVHCENDPLGW